MTNAPASLLRLTGIGKRYAAPVLTDVDFDVRAGEVHALVGANGAGKTTLLRIISGLTPPDGGQMRLDGRPYRPDGKAGAEAAGVRFVMQELNVIGTLTVGENLFLNRLPHRLGRIDRRRLRADARRALEAVGLESIDPDLPAGRLGVGHQQLVEIAAALAHRGRVLLLDEPTAALTDPQIDLLFTHIRRLKAEGVAVVYVSHRMDELRRIADRTTVLRDGRVVATAPTAELPTPELVRLMAGRAVAEHAGGAARVGDEEGLRVEGLRRGTAVRDITFTVGRGEIFGLAGLVGSGRTETLRALFGADPADAGTVFVHGRRVRIRTPRDAVRAGIGLVPEDRKQHGLLLPQPVRVNVTLADLGRARRSGGRLDAEAELRLTEMLARRLDLRYASPHQPAAQLSGGNQQKTVIARWLLRDCHVLLFDEPTRGIDVAAKATVHRLLDNLARRGKTIVVVSSEQDELMALCHRIGVLSAGRLVRTFERGAWSRDALLEAAFSGYLTPSAEPASPDGRASS